MFLFLYWVLGTGGKRLSEPMWKIQPEVWITDKQVKRRWLGRGSRDVAVKPTVLGCGIRVRVTTGDITVNVTTKEDLTRN